MASRLQQPIIGYTLGDQAGVGPEIMRRLIPSLPDHAEYRLIGSYIDVTPGVPSILTAQTAFEHLEQAAQMLKDGSIDAVVTAPVCKETLHQVGFSFPGQTEFFANRMGIDRVVMCLTGKHLTVALATTHVALADVPRLLTISDLVQNGRILCQFLQQTGHASPRIALAGLNPHNGEAGAFGDEEARIIAPAVKELQHLCPQAVISGPCVPDCVYRDAANGLYDAILAPYHDQALIPLKLLDFDTAVNATIGMPRLRVSPDHGTAFNIAGKGIASLASTKRAFEVAYRSCCSSKY